MLQSPRQLLTRSDTAILWILAAIALLAQYVFAFFPPSLIAPNLFFVVAALFVSLPLGSAHLIFLGAWLYLFLPLETPALFFLLLILCAGSAWFIVRIYMEPGTAPAFFVSLALIHALYPIAYISGTITVSPSVLFAEFVVNMFAGAVLLGLAILTGIYHRSFRIA